MIKIYAPGVTVVQVASFLLNKNLTVSYLPSTFHTTGATAVAGVALELDEPDERWDVLLPAIVGFATAMLISRVRVIFSAPDPSLLKGRLSPESYWVYASGLQSET